MRSLPLHPALHLFVCTNRREPSSPLGPGCGARGDALYEELKRRVASRGAHSEIWITRALCLGVCPKRGAAVAEYPSGRILSEVDPGDASELIS